jgi:quercetin dioxygenase-like cupin family protein
MTEKHKDPATGENPAGALLCFELSEEIKAMQSGAQSGRDRVGRSLVKHRDLTVTLLFLRQGAQLAEHQARGSIALQVLDGSVRFNADGKAVTLGRGELAVLEHEVAHAVEALADSTLMLTASLPAASNPA